MMLGTDRRVSEDLRACFWSVDRVFSCYLTPWFKNWGWNWYSLDVSTFCHKGDKCKQFRDWPDPRSPKLSVDCSFSCSEAFHLVLVLCFSQFASCQYAIPWQGFSAKHEFSVIKHFTKQHENSWWPEETGVHFCPNILPPQITCS